MMCDWMARKASDGIVPTMMLRVAEVAFEARRDGVPGLDLSGWRGNWGGWGRTAAVVASAPSFPLAKPCLTYAA